MSFPTREFNIMLRVDSRFNQPNIIMKAGDSNSTVFNIQLINNFSPIDLTGLIVKFTVIKPDGTIVYQTPTIVDAEAGKLSITLSTQTTSVAGISEAEVSIYGSNGERITLFEFNFEVQESINLLEAVESSNEIPALTALLTQCHKHDNKEVLDKVPSSEGVPVGKVLKTGANGALEWADDLSLVGEDGTGYASQSSVDRISDRLVNIESEKSDVGHTHTIADVAELQLELDSKADTGHTHESLYAAKTATETHINDKNNPHAVTKEQIGLSNVDNTSDISKPVSNATQLALNNKADKGHLHEGTYEPAFSKNSGFNLELGTTAGTIAEGNHSHAALHSHNNKAILDSVTNSGDGSKFLANDGTYKSVNAQGAMEVQDDGVTKGIATKVNFATNLDVTVVNGVATINATGSGGAGGDMYKATYDSDDDGIIDRAKTISDGTNTSTALEVKNAVDNATKVESSNINGNLKINGSETIVYTHPTKHSITDVTGLQTALDGKVDDSQVLTNVPAGALFTDTVTSINGKTGVIQKSDLVALGVPAQDTVYIHPAFHPATMITQDSSNRLVTDSQIANWDSKASGTHNHDTVYMGINNAYTKTEVDNKGYIATSDVASISKGVKIGSKRYYNNSGSANDVYVKIGTASITASYTRIYFKADFQITGNADNTGTLECFLFHNTAYNVVNPHTYLTYYNISGKRSLVDGDIVVVKTDSGTAYTYDFWVKVYGYATLNTNIIMTATEGGSLDLLPSTSTTSSTLPNGAVTITGTTIGGSGNKILQNYFKNATQGITSFAVGVTGYSSTTDVIMLYVNGGLLYESVHWTVSGSTITLSNNYSLSIDDEVLVVCNKNAK